MVDINQDYEGNIYRYYIWRECRYWHLPLPSKYSMTACMELQSEKINQNLISSLGSYRHKVGAVKGVIHSQFPYHYSLVINLCAVPSTAVCPATKPQHPSFANSQVPSTVLVFLSLRYLRKPTTPSFSFIAIRLIIFLNIYFTVLPCFGCFRSLVFFNNGLVCRVTQMHVAVI